MLKPVRIPKLSGFFLCFALLLPAASVQAAEAPATVYRQSISRPVVEVYDRLYKSLEDARFYVVFEPNIGANLAHFADKWGEDYNRNKLSGIRSMVFCNGWYVNLVSNVDVDMLGLCPLHLTLIERDGKTTVLFNRPSAIAVDSPALALIKQIEEEVITAINKGLD